MIWTDLAGCENFSGFDESSGCEVSEYRADNSCRLAWSLAALEDISMIVAGLPSAVRLAAPVLLFLAATLFAAESRAQTSKWAPSRTAAGQAEASVEYATPAMHSSAVRSTLNVESSANRPEWQQSPTEQAAAARPSVGRSPAAARMKPTPAPQSQATHFHSVPSRVPVGRTGTSARSDARLVAHQQAGPQSLKDFNVSLAQGEKLVGQPTFTEGGPVNAQPGTSGRTAVQSQSPRSSASGSVQGEMIPVPDSVSGGSSGFGGGSTGRGMQSGKIYNEDGTEYHGPMPQDGATYSDGDIQLDSDFDAFDPAHGGDDCSCSSGNCGGSCQRDEWGDPSRCPECGLYGHHRIGCGHVARCLQNCLGFLFREASIFGGTQGFKGPLDLGINGNFGFNEGFNLAGALVPFPKCGLGYQVGARWAQSDLSGNVFGSAAREQVFLTAGVFHRAYRGCGLQWGLAYDWATDNYYTKATYAQVRTEVSWLTGRGHEFGFWGAFGTQTDEVTFNILGLAVNQTITPSDMYNFFYRYTTPYGGQGRFWGGVTGQSLTIIGSDFRVPMSNRTDLVGGFNYIMPPAGQNGNGTADESWGLAMNIVWYFGRAKEGVHNTPYRPLFNVADNNVMMHDRP